MFQKVGIFLCMSDENNAEETAFIRRFVLFLYSQGYPGAGGNIPQQHPHPGNPYGGGAPPGGPVGGPYGGPAPPRGPEYGGVPRGQYGGPYGGYGGVPGAPGAPYGGGQAPGAPYGGYGQPLGGPYGQHIPRGEKTSQSV